MAGDTISALLKGLDILKLLNDKGGAQVRHLHAATGIPKPTVVRMLDTLCEAGYVARDGAGGYRVTARVLSLSAGFNAADELLRVAQPVLDALREEHTWPSDMAVFDHDAIVILDTGHSPNTLSLNRTKGSRLPATVTALGRAYLAFCPADECQRILDLLASQGDHAARDGAGMARLLEETRRKGHAISNQDYLPTTRAVAVPIMVDGKPVATINMMAVANLISMAKAENLFAPLLKRAAERIGAALVASR